MHLLRGTRANPALCDKDFLFLRALSRSLVEARDELFTGEPRGILLDVGSTWKPYHELFGDRVRRFVALDYALIEGHLLDIVGSADTIPIASASVDCCLCTQVLEHVEDPDTVLRELARVLKPGGILLLSTHGVFHHHPYPHDYWRWTDEGLAKIIGVHFKDVSVRANGGTMLLMAHTVGRGVFHAAEHRPLLRFLQYTLYPLINLAGLAANALIGDRSLSINYLAVARK